ncbi:MAG: hypothetical protein EXX96DRAFT_540539 [Benjaminiella poitrasii]|nr:MAG: hypothetical protein EXX96DRAFT_540539 [Benjaminiella poitrasii]
MKALLYKLLRYITALKETSPRMLSQEGNTRKTNSKTRIVQFIYELFMPFNPHNNAVYNLKDLTTKDIFCIVSLYTDYFDDRSLRNFTAWCSQKEIYIISKQIRKANPTIVRYENFGGEDLVLIDHIRKSKGEEKDGVRVQLLEAMDNRFTDIIKQALNICN